MKRPTLTTLIVAGLTASLLVVVGVNAMPPSVPTPDQPQSQQDQTPTGPLSQVEARGRARLLHETIHATLQFVHEEYYRPDQRLTLPAATLERVFQELAKSQHVKLRWLAVNAQPMNVDHQPQNEFEKQAVAALNAGRDEFEQVESGTYRYAGGISLTSECLKCHLPSRTDNKDRAAALVIAIPLSKK